LNYLAESPYILTTTFIMLEALMDINT